MSRSYERIHYGLRPAKNVERKMLCEALRRLSEFAALESYRYIGFGSTYFSDFILFHKALGLRNMLSIEREETNEDRFRFNCPFSCVRLEFGDSNSVLPALDWDLRTVAWLDYDSKLTLEVLADVAWFFANAVSGSVGIFTVNAQPHRPQARLSLVGRLRDSLGADRVPLELEDRELMEWGTAKTYHAIIAAQIARTLHARNGGRPPANHLVYRELFRFHYQDGARMLTVGGLLHERGETHRADACAFDQLDFCGAANHPYQIDVPCLTYRELRHLERQMPVDDPGELKAPGIPERDLRRYARVYRYFPAFAETEV